MRDSDNSRAVSGYRIEAPRKGAALRGLDQRRDFLTREEKYDTVSFQTGPVHNQQKFTGQVGRRWSVEILQPSDVVREKPVLFGRKTDDIEHPHLRKYSTARLRDLFFRTEIPGIRTDVSFGSCFSLRLVIFFFLAR
jgi:hypothetical protein